MNRFESSIKHKPNVFSMVVQNSNLAPNPNPNLSDKEKEIEEAYQRYLNDQTAKQTAADEKAAARGENAGQAFNINQEDE
jgi:hypothetical protein